MKSRIVGYIESFIPPVNHDDPELLRRSRIFVWVYSLGILLVLTLGLLDFWVGRTEVLWITMVFVAVFYGLLVSFRRGVSSVMLNNAVMLLIYAAFVYGILDLGGLRAANMPFVLLFPLFSLFTSGRVSALFWLAVSVIVIIGLGVMEVTGSPDLNELLLPSPASMVAGYLVGASVIVSMMVWMTESSRVKNQELLHREKQRSEKLLLNILPSEVAEELKAKGEAEAQLIDNATVLFTDFKGFTQLSESLTPRELVADLNACFTAFDHICERHGIEKIKTIGDAYMAAGGLPTPCDDHAQRVVRAALEMAEFVAQGKQGKLAAGLPFFEVRIGIHTGPVVAGIVGVKKFQYDIWGDTVNTASRMESAGETGKVNISEATYRLVKDEFTCEYRGEIEAKGKGKLGMWFVSIDTQ